MHFFKLPPIHYTVSKYFKVSFQNSRVRLSCRVKAYSKHVGPGQTGKVLYVGLFLRSQPAFTQVSEKTKENSEWIVRQARPGIELDTYRLPVLRTEHFGHCWGVFQEVCKSLYIVCSCRIVERCHPLKHWLKSIQLDFWCSDENRNRSISWLQILEYWNF